MEEIIKTIYWLSVQFGLDLRRMLRSLRGIPRYLADWLHFRRLYDGPIKLRPCLYDWYDAGGSTKDEYFLQDLHVARQIHRANPQRHIDIGSRIDGFVAHVASFREIEVFDIRPIPAQIPGVICKQADLMNPSVGHDDYCDSLSCLHALEHFGLGRYGDSINPQGAAIGLSAMAKMVRAGGLFYLSVPIGKERVEFNAHRIFDPASLIRLATANGLLLSEFAWIRQRGTLIQSTSPALDLDALSKLRYTLGIFTFVKQ